MALLNMTYLNMDYVGEIQLLSTFWNGLCNITTSPKDHKEWEASDVYHCFFLLYYWLSDIYRATGSSFYFDLFSIVILFSNYKCAFSKRCIVTDCNLCLLGFKMGCKYPFIIKPQNSSGPYIENWQSINKSNFRTKECSGYIQCYNEGLNGKMLLNNQEFSCI